MNRLFAILIALLCVNVMVAQNTKFGKPSQQEWDMQAWGEEPDAEAVVLCKMVDVSYNLSGAFQSFDSSGTEFSSSDVSTLGANKYMERGLTTMTYKVKMRTKILKESGRKYANVDIVYYSDDDDMHENEELTGMSAVVFYKENGKVKKIKAGNGNITTERLTDEFKVCHIRLPEATAGSIIEYQYELSSTRFPNLYDWYVQDDIPVMFTSCVMNIPVFLRFNMEVPIIANVKSNVKESTILFKNSSNDLSAPKYATSNLYTITSRDLVAWDKMAVGNKSISNLVNGPFMVHATLANNIDQQPVQLPEGIRHIMINP